MIVSTRNKIAVVDLTSVYSKSIIDASQNNAIQKLDLDPLQNTLYFQDDKSIYQSKLDGSNTALLSDKVENRNVWTFAFDSWGKRLFWVNFKERYIIHVAFVDFQDQKYFVHNQGVDVLSLAVDPNHGLVRS